MAIRRIRIAETAVRFCLGPEALAGGLSRFPRHNVGAISTNRNINMAFLNQATIERFYTKTRFLWGLRPPNKYVKQILRLMRPGVVLDVGVGEGRNALFLANKGSDVTGVDISKAAINKFLELAKDRNLEVVGVVEDARKFEPDIKYDMVICTAVLHYFTPVQAKKLVNKIKRCTKKGGINLMTAFTKYDEGFTQYPGLHFFRDEKELEEIYFNWDILKCERYTKRDAHDGSRPHMHDIAVLVARKRI